MLGKEWWLKDPYWEDVERLMAHAVASERNRLRAMVEKMRQYEYDVATFHGEKITAYQAAKLNVFEEVLKMME